MAWYWPRFFFLRVYWPSRPINVQKKNSANIQSPWLHTWSITHTNNNCRNSRELIDLFSWSISGQTHEFMTHRARADNLPICCCKKQIDGSFHASVLLLTVNLRHNIVKVVCGTTRLSPHGSTGTLTMHVVTKFMIKNRTDAWKTTSIC